MTMTVKRRGGVRPPRSRRSPTLADNPEPEPEVLPEPEARPPLQPHTVLYIGEENEAGDKSPSEYNLAVVTVEGNTTLLFLDPVVTLPYDSGTSRMAVRWEQECAVWLNIQLAQGVVTELPPYEMATFTQENPGFVHVYTHRQELTEQAYMALLMVVKEVCYQWPTWKAWIARVGFDLSRLEVLAIEIGVSRQREAGLVGEA